jgi:hypothetical protein
MKDQSLDPDLFFASLRDPGAIAGPPATMRLI